jgi:glycosyltransferase involved in cell wall biosynthesis
MKPRLAYVVTEPGCLKAGSGAYQHIQMGIMHLGSDFTVQPVLSCPAESKSPSILAGKQRLNGAPAFYQFLAKKETGGIEGNRGVDKENQGSVGGGGKGALRDMRDFVRNWRRARTALSNVHRLSPDAIYYRMAPLDPFPLLAKLRGYPVFIEANGLQFESRSRRFRSWISPIYRHFERLIYRKADHVFFVGSYGDYWNLPPHNWTNVENGVEMEFLCEFEQPRLTSQKPVRLVFLGSLMAHHRPDVLVKAMECFSGCCDTELHLVGSNLEVLSDKLGSILPVIHHGFLSRRDLAPVLATMDIGLITGAPQYQSQMKLFDYGAARLAIIAPDTIHLTSWFADQIVFFRNGDAEDMADRLASLVADQDGLVGLGNRLHDRLGSEFTWENIFSLKSATIIRQLGSK